MTFPSISSMVKSQEHVHLLERAVFVVGLVELEVATPLLLVCVMHLVAFSQGAAPRQQGRALRLPSPVANG